MFSGLIVLNAETGSIIYSFFPLLNFGEFINYKALSSTSISKGSCNVPSYKVKFLVEAPFGKNNY